MPYNDSQDIQHSCLDALQELSAKFADKSEQLARAQREALQAAGDEFLNDCRRLLAVRDPQSLAQVQGLFFDPMFQLQRQQRYQQNWLKLMWTSGSILLELADQQLQAGERQARGLAEQLRGNAPGDAGAVGDLLIHMMEKTNSYQEQAIKVAERTFEFMGSGMRPVLPATVSSLRKPAAEAGQA